MSLKTIRGNLIQLAKEGQFDVIAHQANCFCTMRSGIAPQIADNFYSAFRADADTNRGDKAKLGNFSVGKEKSGLLVFNLYGQYGWDKTQGNYGTDEEALVHALNMMANELKANAVDFQTYRIGFPKIGCGLGGGNWERISKHIEEIFDNERIGYPMFDVTYVEYSV
ncbi:hypothetical protein [Salmonella phage 7-11]|uniref:Macro domain-containing protein n=1 Tax=Salmonella phage 7-11 TaxID=1054968 RepID=G0X504_9CAUD|nr:hypothetical protein SaPh711_gp071 [Salmonella phage 7-11]AEK81986.1 hypothetical protein [Salmonella phage 7-11]